MEPVFNSELTDLNHINFEIMKHIELLDQEVRNASERLDKRKEELKTM